MDNDDAGRRGADAVRTVEDEVSMLLRRARLVYCDVARQVHPNLDVNAYGLLLWLRRSGPTRLTDLATLLGLSKGTLSRQLRSLASLGLVRSEPDPADKRAFLLQLTPEGQHRFDLARTTRIGPLRRTLESWHPAELAEFARLLRRFNQSADQ